MTCLCIGASTNSCRAKPPPWRFLLGIAAGTPVARAIYAELHQCDEAGAELIIVETTPPGKEWRGIADRLNRAAGGASQNYLR